MVKTVSSAITRLVQLVQMVECSKRSRTRRRRPAHSNPRWKPFFCVVYRGREIHERTARGANAKAARETHGSLRRKNKP